MNKPSVSAGVVAGVALGAAALGAAAVAVRAACLQVARTRNGLARVKRVHDEGGDEVRVLVQGGVYQSASYVGWAATPFWRSNVCSRSSVPRSLAFAGSIRRVHTLCSSR